MGTDRNDELQPRRVARDSALLSKKCRNSLGLLGQTGRETSKIALATHGWGGLRRMLLGSVTDKVIRGSSLPVLAYRPTA